MPHPHAHGKWLGLLKSRKAFSINDIQVKATKKSKQLGTSETPRVDSVLDSYPIKYSYQYAKELEFIAKELEQELAGKPSLNSIKLITELECKLEKAIERANNLEVIVQSYREKEHKSGKFVGSKFKDIPHHKRYEHLSNDDVMEKLRSLGFNTRQ